MSRIDLKNTTFMIPIRIEHENRMENLEVVLEYLNHNFDTNIIVFESSSQSMLMNHPCIKNDNVKYIWEFSDEKTFHRTKILNDMLSEVETEFVANYDTDVLFPVQSYIDTVELLKQGQVMVFPYLGPFHEVNRKFIPGIKEKKEVNWIPLNECGINHPNSVGGAMFFNTKIYKNLGGECELFNGWGAEDNFRANMFHIMGYNIARTGTVLYHMEHWRGGNSTQNHPDYNNNMKLFYDTAYMNKEQMRTFIDSYNRFK